MSSKTIGQLFAVTTLSGTELIEVEQSGASKYMTLNNIIGTTVITADYTANNFNENIIVNSASALTITIPADLPIGAYKNISRALSATTAITVASSGAETIEGAASFITHGAFAASTLNDAEVVLRKKTATDWRFVGGVVSGSNTYGYYSKTPDGNMKQRGVITGTAIEWTTITLPQNYKDTSYTQKAILAGGEVGRCIVYNIEVLKAVGSFGVYIDSLTSLVNWDTDGPWK